MDVRTLCLGVLTERAMSGYEIKKHFEDAFRHFFAAGFGSIYPALAELARAGLVTVECVEQDRRPDKKVYRITEAGRAALLAELGAAGPRHRVRSDFLVVMYFAHLLPPARIAAMLDGMAEQWRRTLADDLAACEAQAAAGGEPLTPGQRFGLGFGQAVLGAALAHLQRQRGPLLRELEGLHPPARAAAG